MAKTGSADHLLFDRLLTNVIYEKGMGVEGIASALAPRVRSTSMTGQYMRRKRSTRESGAETKRAPGAEVQTGERRGKELDTFRTVDHALKMLIPQEITTDMDETELMSERQSTATDVLQKINHNWETDVHGSVWADNKSGFTSIYPSNSVIDPGAKWASGSQNMKADILKLKNRIYKACGYLPNKMVLPNEVFNVITTENNELRESMKYTTGGPVTLDILANYFEMDEVLVPMYLDDHASGNNEDNPMKFLWTGDHIGLFYVDERSTRNKDTLMSTFYWDDPEEEFLATYAGYNRSRKSEEVEVGGYFTTKEIDMACGGIIADVLS